MPVCEVCRREVDEITTHHLVLRKRRKSKQNKNEMTRVKGRPVSLCRPCHQQTHMLTEQEAAPYF